QTTFSCTTSQSVCKSFKDLVPHIAFFQRSECKGTTPKHSTKLFAKKIILFFIQHKKNFNNTEKIHNTPYIYYYARAYARKEGKKRSKKRGHPKEGARRGSMGRGMSTGGEYYTPRPLIRRIIKVVDPKIGETVYDPACLPVIRCFSDFAYTLTPTAITRCQRVSWTV
ncbi:MAG: N-6 DNA methylase, partial [Bacteroidaceae bacterium]|nr:N-6 DNA methylase [Bacteroidaceae bacterium]